MKNSWFFFMFIAIMNTGDEIEEISLKFIIFVNDDDHDGVFKKI